MSRTIVVSEQECYCKIVEFYENVAKQAGISTEGCTFDVTKIDVSEAIADNVEKYYKDNGYDYIAVAMAWLNYGPKVDVNLQGYTVVFQDDFIREGN